MSGQQYDDPNRQAVGVEPAWVEGTGGGGGEAPAPQAAERASAGTGPDLDSMSKQELLEFAQQLGVKPANNDMTKDELRAGVDEKLGG